MDEPTDPGETGATATGWEFHKDAAFLRTGNPKETSIRGFRDSVFEFVSPRVRDAALKAAAQLTHLGVRHALVDGLAVGAHGYVRATKDVHFLVGDEAFEHHGSLGCHRTAQSRCKSS